MIPAIVNHLWQSTLFATGAAILTLALRRQRARTRYWIWLAASLKFLLPFAALVYAGSFLDWRSTAAAQPAWSQVWDEGFVGSVIAVASPAPVRPASGNLAIVLFAVWSCGFAVVLMRWLREWLRLRSCARSAQPFHRKLPIPAVTVSTALEPGVFGIARPLLLLPHGITDRLTAEEFDAIVAHELCHVRHRDNLIAAVQMLVEAVFWFHPLVWWIGGRLLQERERACDEEVLRAGGDPRIYAEGILKVCEFYLESPLACLSGVTGSDLRLRIRGIMSNRIVHRLGSGRKLLLATAAFASVAVPLVFGILNAPQIRAQSPAENDHARSFDVASIKPSTRDKTPISASVNPQGVEFTKVTLRNLIAIAYSVKSRSISAQDQGTRILMDGFPFDIQAKCDRVITRDEIRLMLRSLLAERFKLALHRESKVEPVYNLVTLKSGPKLQDSAGTGSAGCALGSFGGATCHHVNMAEFTNYLSDRMGRVVLDRTSLTGTYDFDLHLDGTPGLDQIREAMASGSDPGDTKRSLATSMRDWTGSSIFSDIQKQLGLKLEADRAPVDNIVIDHAQRPSEN